MRTLVDARLREEAERFRFRHTCDDCVHFTGTECAHGYPTEAHRAPIASTEASDAPTWIVFCKEHEL